MSPDFYFSIAKVLKVVIVVLSVVAAVVFFIGLVYLPVRESRRRKKKLAQLYASREPLDEEEFYRRFYHSRAIPMELVVMVRRILEEEFCLDMSRVLPEDDFTGNLRILWGNWSGLDGLEAVEVVIRFEKEFRITISDAEAAGMKTVEDIIVTISGKVKQPDNKTRIA
jgi:acyl carrier protein